MNIVSFVPLNVDRGRETTEDKFFCEIQINIFQIFRYD